MHKDHNEEYRYGSARWATEREMRRAGLFKESGIFIGFHGKKRVYSDGDAPVIVVAGAGGGKMASFMAYNLCAGSGEEHEVIIDLRGELAATSIQSLIRTNVYCYIFNPFRLHGLPQDRMNIFDLLDPIDERLHTNAQLMAESIIELSGAGSGKFFELRAIAWLKAILIALTLRDGYVDATTLMEAINSIESDAIKWASLLEFMLNCKFEDVQSIAGEMLAKQQDNPQQFGSFVAEIYAYTSFLNDPVIKASLSDPTFSLKAITSHEQIAKIFIVIPAEYINQLRALVKLVGTNVMLYKAQSPDSPRVVLYVDEAGQLGRADFLMRAFTYGRGLGLRAVALFQSIAQIKHNYYPEAVQEFMSSAATRLYFGVRDFDTAKLISDMAGYQTLQYKTLKQDEAAKKKVEQIRDVFFNGADPLIAGKAHQYYDKVENTRDKQTRKLITPDEVLNMSEDRAIVFMSGKNLHPMQIDKRPYYLERSMAGLYMPNPYHPPTDKVLIKAKWGTRWKKVITEPVPQEFAHYPQYASGEWKYIEGFRPKI
ncbi:MAG: type IV secretory system conjugative DNA transfer family protein [Alphaproteobacteria bacterium]|nr:type IV secretory system conjugative DNA transfer family protein [Alphaproteobacteria bacterium]